MKIATFNINNVVGRLDNLIDWLAQEEPDVVCLQELKADQGAFPAQALEQMGYHAAWSGERTWNGVAILARGAQPVVTRTRLPGDTGDRQARYIEAALGGVLIASHGVAALYLGYQPRIGAAMAMALAVAWLGAAAGRAISAVLDGEAGRYNSGAMVFNALIGLTLSLPFFNIGRVVIEGARLA